MRDNVKKADCAVRAICNATGEDYDTVEAALIRAGRRVNTGTYCEQLTKAVRDLGYKIAAKNFRRGTTVRTAPREFPGGAWILFMRGHFASVVDGTVIDWSEGRKKRVIYAFHVSKG